MSRVNLAGDNKLQAAMKINRPRLNSDVPTRCNFKRFKSLRLSDFYLALKTEFFDLTLK